MSFVNNSSDINMEIFIYLTFEELLNMYKTNKTIIKDNEKYTQIKYKKSFKQLYLENKCLHCNNFCDNINFKVCDNCAADTCWTCYNKVGNTNLYFISQFDISLKIWYPSYKCFNKCVYKCKKCKRNYNHESNIIIKQSVVTCFACNILK